MQDSQDTFLNGLLTGIATPVLFYFIWSGLSYVLSNYILDNWSGFTFKFICIASVVANAIPVYLYNRYERGVALRGIVGMTILMVFAIIFYFWDDFLK